MSFFALRETYSDYTDSDDDCVEPVRQPQPEPREESCKNMATLSVKGLQLPTADIPAYVLKPGVDFTTWKAVLKNELKAHGLDHMLEENGNRKIPKATRGELTGWTNAYILSRVNDRLKQAVADAQTPFKMMEKIQNLVQPVIPQARFAVKRTFQTIKMREDESVSDFINRFEIAQKQAELYDAKNVDRETREIDAVDNFLAAISDRYKNVVTVFNAKPDKEKTLDVLQAELKSEEATVSDTKTRGDDGDKTAAFIKAESFKRDREVKHKRFHEKSYNQSKKKRCTRCGKMNHSYKECRNPKWLCYNCLTLTDQHQGWNCPHKAGSSYSKFKWVKDSKKEIKFPKKKPQGNANFTNLDEIPGTSTVC